MCPVHNSGISGMDLENKTVCLTGNFDWLEQVEELLTSMGATCKNSVNKSTDIVIMGGLGSKAWSIFLKSNESNGLNEKGCNIIIVHENGIFK